MSRQRPVPKSWQPNRFLTHPAPSDDEPNALDDVLLTAENVEPTPKAILGYQYAVDCILKAWLLSRHLARVTPDLNAVVMLATSIGLQPEMADAVADALTRGTLKLPGKEILRESHFRLNLLDLMYQRELHNSLFSRATSAPTVQDRANTTTT